MSTHIPALAGLKSKTLGEYYRKAYPFICRASRASLRAAPVTRLLPPARLYLDRPGKLLRPLITHILLGAFGKDPRHFSGILGAIELMETSTVSFDDIIDSSGLRRGGPSTHKVYGVQTAYLAYQAAYSHSYRAFLEPALSVDERGRTEILAALAREIFAYGWGQALELYWSAKKLQPTPGQYLYMTWDRIRFLSFNGPFRIGALLGGAPGRNLEYFETAGSWAGMAYHLRGDELNLKPASPAWGKPLADDITSGRYTFILLTALKRAALRDRKTLLAALGAGGLSDDALKNAINIIENTGAFEENRRRISLFAGRALDYLGRCALSGKWENLLSDLIRFMAYDRKK